MRLFNCFRAERSTLFPIFRLVFLGCLSLAVGKGQLLAQAPPWSRVETAGGTGSDAGNSLAIGPDGSIYVVGRMEPPATFGSRTASGSLAFLAKYNPQGTASWVSAIQDRFGGSYALNANGVAVDAAGNLLVTGSYFRDQDGYAVYIANYLPNGQLNWFRSSSGLADDYKREGKAIAVDKHGNIVVVGNFLGTLDLAGAHLTAGSHQGFIAKYDPSGSAVWAKNLGGTTGSDRVNGVAVDGDDNIYVTGHFQGTARLGSLLLEGSAKYHKAFVVKFSSSGSTVWAKKIGTSPDLADEGSCVATDANGDCYVASLADWRFSPESTSYAVTKLARQDGLTIWSRKLGPFDGIDEGSLPGPVLAVAPFGSVILAVGLQGGGFVGSLPFSSLDQRDILLVGLGPDSSIAWTKQAGDVFPETPRGVALDAAGNVYVTGSFYSDSQFGPFPVHGEGGEEMFLAKLGFQAPPNFQISAYVNGEAVLGNSVTAVAPARVDLRTTFPDGSLFYTLDGTQPTAFSHRYTEPFSVSQDILLRAITYSADFKETGDLKPLTLKLTPGFALTTRTEGGGTFALNPATGPYASNSKVVVAALPNPGWKFLGWLGDATGTGAVVTVTLDQPRSVEAIFGTVLTTSAGGAGTVTREPNRSVYPYGTKVQLAGVPGPDWSFAAWGNDAVGFGNPLTLFVTNAEPNVTALFLPLSNGQHSLTTLSSGHGRVRVLPLGSQFASGQSITLTAVPEPGEEFLGWKGDATGSLNPLPLTMTADKTITATFTRKPRLRMEDPRESVGKSTIRLSVTGEIGERYTIQRSADLGRWIPRGNTTNVFGTASFTDLPEAKASSQFYRVVVSP